VNGTADAATVAALNGNGSCDLREAIQAANTNTVVNECVGGALQEERNLIISGVAVLDLIVFDLASGTPTINIVAPLPVIIDAISINGNTGMSTRVELNGQGRLAPQMVWTSPQAAAPSAIW
jgi:hypothetical protein